MFTDFCLGLKIPMEPMKWKAKAMELELDSPLETMWAKESVELMHEIKASESLHKVFGDRDVM
eukprot:scaffold1926_cov170-Alexandrium_tamarense.AAC.1